MNARDEHPLWVLISCFQKRARNMATTYETTLTEYSGPRIVGFKPHGLDYFPGVPSGDTRDPGVNRGCTQTNDPVRHVTLSRRSLLAALGSATDNTLKFRRRRMVQERRTSHNVLRNTQAPSRAVTPRLKVTGKRQ